MDKNLYEIVENIEKDRILKLSEVSEFAIDRILSSKIMINEYSSKPEKILDMLINIKKYKNQHEHEDIIKYREYRAIMYQLGIKGLVVVNNSEVGICRNNESISKILKMGIKYADTLKHHKDYIPIDSPVSVAGKTQRVIVIDGKLEIDARF